MSDNTDPKWYEILCFALLFCLVICPLSMVWIVVTLISSNDVDEVVEYFL